MKLFTTSGLSGNDFATAVFMASDERIAQAVKDWMRDPSHPAARFICDDPATLIDCACGMAKVEISDEDIKTIVNRVEHLASARGILLPELWSVIY